jgi:peroxiredoxin
MEKQKADRGLKILLVLLFLGFAYVIRDSFEQRIVDVGDKAPRFAVTTESGRRISTSEFGGKLLVVNFWATWCPPCIDEMPSLNSFARDLSGDGVVVLGISVDSNERAYRSFLQRNQLAFEVARDPEADIPSEYGTFKWPETYVINKSGRVVQKYIGPRTWTDSGLVREIRSLL